MKSNFSKDLLTNGYEINDSVILQLKCLQGIDNVADEANVCIEGYKESIDEAVYLIVDQMQCCTEDEAMKAIRVLHGLQVMRKVFEGLKAQTN